MAYFTLVRPIIEYAAPVWDPYTKRNIYKIEMVQRRAARFVCGRYHNTSSVSEMLQDLEWPSLQQRREMLRLVLFYKIHHNLVIFDTSPYITPALRATRNTHHQGYQIPTSTTEYHRYNSFFPRTVKSGIACHLTSSLHLQRKPSTSIWRLGRLHRKRIFRWIFFLARLNCTAIFCTLFVKHRTWPAHSGCTLNSSLYTVIFIS